MQETKTRRGRPARGESHDPQSTLCTIKDPAMEPFYVVKDATNFTVIEKSITTRGFGGKAATGKEQEKIVGYYTSFSNALNCIAKQKFLVNQGEYSSLKEYITTWNKVKDGLESLLKSIEI